MNGNHGSFVGVKWPGHEANNSLLYSAEIKSEWNYTSTPPYAFIVRTRTTLPLLYTLNYMGPHFISGVVFLMPLQVISPDTSNVISCFQLLTVSVSLRERRQSAR